MRVFILAYIAVLKNYFREMQIERLTATFANLCTFLIPILYRKLKKIKPLDGRLNQIQTIARFCICTQPTALQKSQFVTLAKMYIRPT